MSRGFSLGRHFFHPAPKISHRRFHDLLSVFTNIDKSLSIRIYGLVFRYTPFNLITVLEVVFAIVLLDVVLVVVSVEAL